MRNCVIDSYAGPLNNFTGKTDYENDILAVAGTECNTLMN